MEGGGGSGTRMGGGGGGERKLELQKGGRLYKVRGFQGFGVIMSATFVPPFRACASPV